MTTRKNSLFEQEAVNRVLQQFGTKGELIVRTRIWEDGANFGYNFAKNEWHYVKDGDLPRQYEHTCFSVEVLASNKKWVYYRFDSGKWFCGNREVKVTAWKEIIFPKEVLCSRQKQKNTDQI